jgi:hypothetical protein
MRRGGKLSTRVCCVIIVSAQSLRYAALRYAMQCCALCVAAMLCMLPVEIEMRWSFNELYISIWTEPKFFTFHTRI